jgi:Family of unknown function (DUF6111)
MRVIVENILLFLLPTVAYVGYRMIVRRPDQTTATVMTDAPLLLLLGMGTLLVVAVLVAFGDVSGGKPGQVFVPTVVKDGKVIPGHSRAP